MEYSDNEQSDFYADGPEYTNAQFFQVSDETQKTDDEVSGIGRNEINPLKKQQYDKYNSQFINNTSELVPVKPRKITASTSDFQQKFKTEICLNWELSKCKFGSECTFAHGDHELLVKSHIHSNYRTK